MSVPRYPALFQINTRVRITLHPGRRPADVPDPAIGASESWGYHAFEVTPLG